MADNNNAALQMQNNKAGLAAANSEKTITKMITGIGRSATKLNQTIHECAVLCLEHALNYGEVNRTFAKLVEALPQSHRRGLLVKWAETFSPVVLGKDSKTGGIKGHLRGTAEERKDLWNIEAAKATPFFAMPEAQREPDLPTYDSIHNNVVTFINRMLKQAEKIADEEQKKKAIADITKMKEAVPAIDKEIQF